MGARLGVTRDRFLPKRASLGIYWLFGFQSLVNGIVATRLEAIRDQLLPKRTSLRIYWLFGFQSLVGGIMLGTITVYS
jgi:hypothetical protein